MKKQVFNPYLPLNEYVPDGEPHLFNGRVYIYGSHDVASGKRYCEGDYVTWSAPEDDLTNWQYEGIIYKRNQDPSNLDGKLELWAPDVAQGPDGRFYLYYCLAFFLPEIGVAVSDSPAGPFEFYGHVRYPKEIMEGKKLGEKLPFDPAVLVDDDNRVFLYYGYSPVKVMPKPSDEEIEQMEISKEDFNRIYHSLNNDYSPGAMCVELEQDMVTLKGVPEMCAPGGRISKGTGFEGHAFYEAPSIRKVGKKYYFIYSSELSHELCYAISDYPNKDYKYGGTINSNGDVGLNGQIVPTNMAGNNHGSILKVKNNWYVFYHRQTHGTESSRQGCAEMIKIMEDGKIPQAELTSCGLNNGPLVGKGAYSSAIASHLCGIEGMGKVNYGDPASLKLPYIYQENNSHLIKNISNGDSVGFKYFNFNLLKCVELELRGTFKGEITLYCDTDFKNSVGTIDLTFTNNNWKKISIKTKDVYGVLPLYIKFNGEGNIDFKDFTLI